MPSNGVQTSYISLRVPISCWFPSFFPWRPLRLFNVLDLRKLSPELSLYQHLLRSDRGPSLLATKKILFPPFLCLTVLFFVGADSVSLAISTRFIAFPQIEGELISRNCSIEA